MKAKDVAIMKGIKDLASATLIQAAKDYCDDDATPNEKKAIIKELKSPWMDFLTNGTSKNIAEELLHNERVIKKRININIGVN